MTDNSQNTPENANDRNYAYALHVKSQDRINDYIVYLAGGALGTTVVFISDVIDLSESKHTYLLIFSWISFIASLLIHLRSFFISIDYFETVISSEGVEEDNEKETKRRNQIKQSHFCSIGGIILGILAFFSFLTINIMCQSVKRMGNNDHATFNTTYIEADCDSLSRDTLIVINPSGCMRPSGSSR